LEFAFASVTTAPTRGGIQRFAFRTTRAADVQAEIQTLTGRTVRTLRTRTRAREESAITWDGRNEEGAALPAGPYMLSLTARDAEGNVIMVQRPVVRRN
jgi:flagellar basal-body rod modification protein FlgD